MKLYPETFSKQPAVQLEYEFRHLLDVVTNNRVSSYLEVGAGRGDTFHEIGMHMPPGSRLMAVDRPGQAWGLQDSQKMLDAAVADLIKQGYDASVFYGDSKQSDAFAFAMDQGLYDLVMIDGDHSYEGVKADWENYGIMGRMVAFHDIADPGLPNDRGEVIEVKRFWDELKTQYPHAEFIDRSAQFPMGIGLIFRERQC